MKNALQEGKRFTSVLFIITENKKVCILYLLSIFSINFGKKNKALYNGNKTKPPNHIITKKETSSGNLYKLGLLKALYAI